MGLLTSNSDLASIVKALVSFMNVLIGVLAALAIVIFFWGIVRYIYHSDDAHSRQEGRSTMLWGLVALFVLFSLWGILQVLNIALFGGTINSSSGNVNWNAPTGQYNTSGPAANGGIYPI